MFQNIKGEWLQHEQERIVELAGGAHVVIEFSNTMGLGHMDLDMFPAAVWRACHTCGCRHWWWL